MIKPVFFPFTSLRQRDARQVLTFFKSVFFFSTSLEEEMDCFVRNLADNGAVHPVYPRRDDAARVMKKIEEYKAFAQLNKDSGGRLKDFLKTSPYFKSDTSVFRIRSEIEGGIEKKSSGVSHADTFLKNLLFLRLANMADAEKADIAMRLKEIEEREEELFFNIRGIDEKGDHGKLKKRSHLIDAPTEEEIAERIDAWAQFFKKSHPFDRLDSSVIFVTTTPLVIDYLTSVCKRRINILDIKNYTVHEDDCENSFDWKLKFHRFIENRVKQQKLIENIPAEAHDGCAGSADVKIDILKGGYIHKIFNEFSEGITVCRINL